MCDAWPYCPQPYCIGFLIAFILNAILPEDKSDEAETFGDKTETASA